LVVAVELRHLRYLVAVADATTFSGAAQRVGVAQPALTRQLRELERELGAPLFVSGARRATLTPAGEAAVQVARHVRDEIATAVERARLTQRGLAGRCVLCVSRAPLMEQLPARLVQLARIRCPDVTIDIVEGEFMDLWDKLAEGVVDIGLGQPPPKAFPSLLSETQSQQRVDTAVLSTDHPLATRASLRLEELHAYPFVWVDMADNSATVYSLTRDELLRRGFPRAGMIGVPNTTAIIATVNGKHGWTAIPKRIVPGLITGVVAIPIEDLAIPARFCRLWRRADQRPVTLTVLELLRVLEQAEREPSAPVAKPEDSPEVFVPPRLELRHLRTFVRVVHAGSVGRAADELGVTQPALSRQMRDLEHDVGVPLLERGTRGARPTVAGESLYKDAMDLLAAADGIKANVERAERGASGRCLLAVGPSPPVQELVGKALRHCAETYASMEVIARDMPWPAMTRALKNCTIDVALGWGPHASRPVAGIRRLVIAEDPLDTVLLSVRHPLASRRSVRLEELAKVPFLFVSRSFSSVIFDRIMVAFSERGFAPHIEGTYDGLHTIWSMVAAGMGWSLAGHSQRVSSPPGTSAIALDDLRVPWDVELLYRRDEARAPVLALIDSIRSRDGSVPAPSYNPPSGTTPKAAIS
jgi:DNA-binding transcriptional LysR family regulator